MLKLQLIELVFYFLKVIEVKLSKLSITIRKKKIPDEAFEIVVIKILWQYFGG